MGTCTPHSTHRVTHEAAPDDVQGVQRRAGSRSRQAGRHKDGQRALGLTRPQQALSHMHKCSWSCTKKDPFENPAGRDRVPAPALAEEVQQNPVRTSGTGNLTGGLYVLPSHSGNRRRALKASKAKKLRAFWGAEWSTLTRLPLYRPPQPLCLTTQRPASSRLAPWAALRSRHTGAPLGNAPRKS